MTNQQPKKKLQGPWRSVHAAIWLIGIYILATHNWWWPGILVLVGISALYEAILRSAVPEAFVEERSTPLTAADREIAPAEVIPPPAAVTTAPVEEHRIDLLPQVCPSCNAPVRGYEVKWTGPQSADCPYCGTNLPMNKA